MDVDLCKERALIGGRWLDDNHWLHVDNSAAGEILGVVPSLGRAEPAALFDAAPTAFPPWRRVPAAEGAALLERWFALIVEATADLARLLTLEHCKPRVDARNEVTYGATFMRWLAG